MKSNHKDPGLLQCYASLAVPDILSCHYRYDVLDHLVGVNEALFPKSTIKKQLPWLQVTVTLGVF